MKNNLKKALCLVLLVGYSLITPAQQFLTTIDGWNAYVHLPDEYNDSVTKRYPLICFLPGIGETGTTASRLLINGPGKFIADGHNMQFWVNGKLEKPIVISLQPAQNWTSPWQLNPKIDSILRRWRCDVQRINLTGLSMGGQAWENYVAGTYGPFTARPASMVIMSAPAPDNGNNKMALFAQAGGKWWGFEGTTDYRQMDIIRDTLNRAVAGSGRYTQYTGGHCCWNTWYDPAYNENGESIYTWMLKQRKSAPPATPNADAGRDTITPVVVPAIPLKGSGNDPNGYPISFEWTKVGGPAGGVFTNANIATPTVTGLVSGTYQFSLKVNNNLGGFDTDTITVINGMMLPVKLTAFRAIERDGQALISWTTSTEINSSHFVLERSTNGRIFSPAAEVAARGGVDQTTYYHYADLQAVAGTNFYRLKMVDRDGSFTYSEVVSLYFKKSGSSSLAVANAALANHQLLLELNSATRQKVRVRLTDNSGKVLLAQDWLLEEGSNSLRKNVFSAGGIYYLQLKNDEGNVTRALLQR